MHAFPGWAPGGFCTTGGPMARSVTLAATSRAIQEMRLITAAARLDLRAPENPSLAGALRRFPGDGGAIGMVAIDEDFFVIVRVAGPSVRILLSDITAAEEWELASSAVAETNGRFRSEAR